MNAHDRGHAHDHLRGHGAHGRHHPGGTIDIRLRDLGQLFDPFDPASFAERDVDPRVEAHIVDFANDLPAGAHGEVVIHVGTSAAAGESERAGEAIRAHFARRSTTLRRDLRMLMRRGRISLCIGLACLAASIGLAQLLRWVFGEGPLGTLLHESVVIGGWVAMWRPLEICLYEWWPILGERRMCDRLSKVAVRVIDQDADATLATRGPRHS